MTDLWSRRELVRALSTAALAGKSAQASVALCSVSNHRGEPLSPADFTRFHVCDLRMRPTPIAPRFEAGQAAFDPPQYPFRIGLPLVVPGFGHVFVYADNRGRGLSARSFSSGKPLQLNYEFAADRWATVSSLIEECRRSGVIVSAAAHRRAGAADALLRQAATLASDQAAMAKAAMESLRESLWAGEMIVLERAQQAIAQRGPRPGFLFGCNAFQYPEKGRPYADRFEAAFNYATLPFYRGLIEPELGHRSYSSPARLLDWLGNTGIVSKGHPLIFLSDETPQWLRNLSFDETRRLCLIHVRESILKFRGHIHVWDVVNEAHVQPEPETGMRGFTKAQNVELTTAALREARQADPTCFRIVNSTGTWCDYYMGRNPAPWQQSVYDYLQMLKDAGAEYEAIGLQYYHSGRDMLEFERNLETFKNFGKPIHITELGYPSSSEERNPKDEWWGGGIGGCRMVWHGERNTEGTQADWLEQLYTIAFSKPYVEALTWWDLNDDSCFMPHGGLLSADNTPKPAYDRLSGLLAKWRSPAHSA